MEIEMSAPLSHPTPATNELLRIVLDVHGGLENWRRIGSLSAKLVVGGPFWTWRGWPDAELRLTAQLDAQREHISLAPFGAPDRIAVFDVDPERVTIKTRSGEVVEEGVNPRSSFPPFDLVTTKWDAIQVAYFASYAIWNYLAQPFSFTYPGVTVREIEPWHEDGETWRRLAVGFPTSNANHNADQVFYYDPRFMLRRMDYSPEVTGNAPVAHYTHNPATFDEFVFPTRRRVHLRDANGIADQSFAAITVDIDAVRVHRR
jgi:hypothetical protein